MFLVKKIDSFVWKRKRRVIYFTVEIPHDEDWNMSNTLTPSQVAPPQFRYIAYLIFMLKEKKINYWLKASLNSNVLMAFRNWFMDGIDLMSGGNLFQRLGPPNANLLSPSLRLLFGFTSNRFSFDLRFLPGTYSSNSSWRYSGAEPFTHL